MVAVRTNKASAIFSYQSSAVFSLTASTHGENSEHTDVCFRRLQWLGPEGQQRLKLEVVLVVSSGDLEEDSRRIATLDEEGSSAQNSHVRPNIWHGAQLTMIENDFGHVPSCAKMTRLSP